MHVGLAHWATHHIHELGLIAGVPSKIAHHPEGERNGNVLTVKMLGYARFLNVTRGINVLK